VAVASAVGVDVGTSVAVAVGSTICVEVAVGSSVGSVVAIGVGVMGSAGGCVAAGVAVGVAVAAWIPALTVNAFVCARPPSTVNASARIEFVPAAAHDGTVSCSPALPVFEVFTRATSTHVVPCFQRIRTVV